MIKNSSIKEVSKRGADGEIALYGSYVNGLLRAS